MPGGVRGRGRQLPLLLDSVLLLPQKYLSIDHFGSLRARQFDEGQKPLFSMRFERGHPLSIPVSCYIKAKQND